MRNNSFSEYDLRDECHCILGSLIKIFNDLSDQRLVLLIDSIDGSQDFVGEVKVVNFFV